eukprot:scaffold6671_cov376-Prasinococcus_capsulatus_cf.AAC.1
MVGGTLEVGLRVARAGVLRYAAGRLVHPVQSPPRVSPADTTSSASPALSRAHAACAPLNTRAGLALASSLPSSAAPDSSRAALARARASPSWPHHRRQRRRRASERASD